MGGDFNLNSHYRRSALYNDLQRLGQKNERKSQRVEDGEDGERGHRVQDASRRVYGGDTKDSDCKDWGNEEDEENRHRLEESHDTMNHHLFMTGGVDGLQKMALPAVKLDDLYAQEHVVQNVDTSITGNCKCVPQGSKSVGSEIVDDVFCFKTEKTHFFPVKTIRKAEMNTNPTAKMASTLVRYRSKAMMVRTSRRPVQRM